MAISTVFVKLSQALDRHSIALLFIASASLNRAVWRKVYVQRNLLHLYIKDLNLSGAESWAISTLKFESSQQNVPWILEVVKTAPSTEQKVNKTWELISLDSEKASYSIQIFTETVRGPRNMSKLEGHRQKN